MLGKTRNLFSEMAERPAFDRVTTDPLQLPLFTEKKITADVLRLDKIHPVISGNKWFKLKYYIEKALREDYRIVVTFGGAYSNHLLALACAAAEYGLQSTGIVRGERPEQLSPTLEAVEKYGMELVFISRTDYRLKNTAECLSAWAHRFPRSLIIPEGGAGVEGIRGSEEMMLLTPGSDYTDVICAVGTGTMFCGLVRAADPAQSITGISVLKGLHDWPELIHENLKSGRLRNCRLVHDYHFGGYAKKTQALIDFMNDLYRQTGIPSDFVYTAKLFFGVLDMVQNDHFKAGSRLLVIHSGGVQGNLSLPQKTLIF